MIPRATAIAGIILTLAITVQGQEAPETAPAAATAQTAPAQKPANPPTRQPGTRDRRRAAKLYLDATKLFEKEQFEAALRGYEQAATLDPTNNDYALAAKVARSHTVTALIQAAAQQRIHGDAEAAQEALARAAKLDPDSNLVLQHVHELADDSLRQRVPSPYENSNSINSPVISLAPSKERRSFHLHAAQRQVIEKVFKAYGIDTTLDESVRGALIRFDVDDADFEQATHALGLLSASFFVPLDAHRAIVAHDNRENRQRFTRQELETIYLPGLAMTELSDLGTLAKNLFEAQEAVIEQTAGTLTIRAPEKTLNAFNATVRELLDGRSQVMLEVRLIQIAHTNERNTGAHLPEQITAFNVYSQEQSILNSNQSLVQEIISQGLAAPGDTAAILAILIASGAVTNQLFSNGFALFGGGITLSGISPGPASANLNLNSSDSRELDQIQLRLGDGEAGTIRTGTRYPIQTSSFSSLSAGGVNIPGLTSTGSSSSLSSILSQAGGSGLNVPQVEYQDLGLTLKATPRVLRSGEVALTLDLKIDALSGQTINGNPILNNRALSGVITLRQGEGVVVLSELNRQESRAISDTPGISEIPGLNDLTGKDVSKNYSSLLIVITPQVIRGTQAAGHSARMHIERNPQAR